jgi:hypothetical protein
MKILLLASDDVSAYYSASLMQGGHQIITHGGGVSRSENPADWMPAIKQYMECDGCLLLGDDPQMIRIASRFGETGKPVWRHFVDVPGVNTRVNVSRHHRLLYLLVPLFLMAVGALVIRQISFREQAKPVAIEDKPPVAMEEKPPLAIEDKQPVAKEEKAPLVDKSKDASAQANEPGGKNCEKELRRTADLFRSFVNRIQSGEEAQSVVADMRQQEKRITACLP